MSTCVKRTQTKAAEYQCFFSRHALSTPAHYIELKIQLGDSMELNGVDHNSDGYEKLACFYEHNKDKFIDDVELVINGWFDAFLAAPLGLTLDKIQEGFNSIQFSISPAAKTILQKNGFLSHYGEEPIHDSYKTTIPYKKIKPTDGKYFLSYVQEYFVNRPELPRISVGLAKKITEGILELFQNAVIHSQATQIYTCGQFFPKAHSIVFCLADNGIGFRNTIIQRFNKDIPSSFALRWAMEDGHTTKKDAPGGLGLGILKKFIHFNKGKMQIVSYDGLYQIDMSGEIARQMDCTYPGTIATIEFSTNDQRNYCLASERQ